MFFEEWNDGTKEVIPPHNTVPIQVLFMIVVAPIDVNVSNAKKSFQLL